jgi:NADP-dependent 3-hydroxy acid dehydrogenase YdfG
LSLLPAAVKVSAGTRLEPVVIADFDSGWLESADRELGQLTETLAVKVDVRDEGAVKNMVDQALKRFGQIDVLINDAAIVPHFAWGNL